MKRQQRKSHTVSNYQSIVFNANGSIADTDLESHIRPNALSDTQKAHVGVRTHKTTDTFRYQQNGSNSATPSITSVQLSAKTGLVKVGGFEVTPEVAATLAEVAPSLTEDPSVKAAEEAKASDAAREDEAQREDLGRHADEALESYHQHVVGECSAQNLISWIVYGQRAETPPESLLQAIANEMGEPLGTAIDKVNAVVGGVHRQFTNLATAMGVNPDKAADWLREHRKDTSMVASQAHLMRRDVRAWLPLLEAYRDATGDGVKH
jgi:hypothetical protein